MGAAVWKWTRGSPVIDAEARRQGLQHDEMHTKVEYVVAHGISSSIDGQKAIIGSFHFVFEDEAAEVLPEDKAAFIKAEKASGRRVVSSILETAEIAASASPRNPIVRIASRPCSSRSL